MNHYHLINKFNYKSRKKKEKKMRKILFFVLIYLIYQVGNAAQSREHCLVIPTVPIYNFDMSSFGNATIVSGFHT